MKIVEVNLNNRSILSSPNDIGITTSSPFGDGKIPLNKNIKYISALNTFQVMILCTSIELTRGVHSGWVKDPPLSTDDWSIPSMCPTSKDSYQHKLRIRYLMKLHAVKNDFFELTHLDQCENWKSFVLDR